MSDFFRNLGQAICSDPTLRHYFRDTINANLSDHLGPPKMAKDSAMRRIMAKDQADMPVRGAASYGAVDQEEDDPDDDNDNDAPVSLNSDDCMLLVQKCIEGLDPDERDAFMEALSNYFQQDMSTGGNNSPTNTNAMDRRRRKGARDGVVTGAVNAATKAVNTGSRVSQGGPVFGDRRRRGAQDSNITNRMLNASNFTKKWGKLTNHISVR
jgi:hypothetical protein